VVLGSGAETGYVTVGWEDDACAGDVGNSSGVVQLSVLREKKVGFGIHEKKK
jgi:hypothetical protein